MSEQQAMFIKNTRRQNKIEQEEKELEEFLKSQSGKEEEEVKDAGEEKTDDVKLPREEETFKKRYGDLRRHMQKKEEEWKEKFEQLEAQVKGTKTFVAPKTDEDLDEWVRKHPDVAAIVQTLAAKEADKRFSKTQQEIEEFKTAKYEAARIRAEQTIRDAHPDFDELKNADDLHDWAEEQPKWVQDALYENDEDPKAVIRVLDLYKVDKGLTKKAVKEREKEAAGFIKPGARAKVSDNAGEGTFTESQVSKMSAKEYARLEDKISEAIRTGKFIYDISGGAR